MCRNIFRKNKICLLGTFSFLLVFFIAGCEQKNELLPVFKSISSFSLADQKGAVFTERDLKGKIWVGDLIFSRCNDTCPLQSIEMSKLQQEFLKEQLFSQFSVTIDPKFDVSTVLEKYGKRFGANFKKWFFLTGEKVEINKLVQFGLGLSAEIAFDHRKKGMNSFFDRTIKDFFLQNAFAHHPAHKKKPNFRHSFRFVLIDTELRVRGYYFSNDRDALSKLREDISILLKINK